MGKKIMNFFFDVVYGIKEFMIHWGLKILVLIFFLMIIHNILKMAEVSNFYKGPYKNLQEIYSEKKLMNIYSIGEGDKTIVILPGFGSQSPVIQYKTLWNNLKDDYRVVVVEYFGYGYSAGIKEERTNEKIAEEIKMVLDAAGIYGPYVLMPHSLSNMYAMKFQEMYPDLVQSIISIDGTYPAEVKDEFRLSKIKDGVSNINATSIWELTGFERILSYVSPKTFYIDKMQEMTDVYNKEDISIYRNRIGSSYLTRTMVREINKLEDNMKEMSNYVYPEYLPVLEILATDTIDEYKIDKENGNSSVDLYDLAETLVSNGEIQEIREIAGNHMLQFSNRYKLLETIRDFLSGI